MNRQRESTDGRTWEPRGAGADGVVQISMAIGAPLSAILTLLDTSTIPEPLLVAVHGIGRHAEKLVACWSAWARRLRVHVPAPRFGDDAFRGFQRLEAGNDGQTADGAPVQLPRVPLLVTAAESDHEPDSQQRRRDWIDGQRGVGRLDRAKRWVDALRAEAVRRRLAARAAVQILPGAGHASADCMAAGFPEQVSEFFGTLPWLWRGHHTFYP